MYAFNKLPGAETERYRNSDYVQFADDADLKEQIDEILDEVHQIADFRNCEITDLSLQEESTGRYWNEYDGG